MLVVKFYNKRTSPGKRVSNLNESPRFILMHPLTPMVLTSSPLL